jgi:hypothetical protein
MVLVQPIRSRRVKIPRVTILLRRCRGYFTRSSWFGHTAASIMPGMKLRNARRRTSPTKVRPAVHVLDPLFFLPVALDALERSGVSCPQCSVKLINRRGAHRWPLSGVL